MLFSCHVNGIFESISTEDKNTQVKQNIKLQRQAAAAYTLW